MASSSIYMPGILIPWLHFSIHVQRGARVPPPPRLWTPFCFSGSQHHSSPALLIPKFLFQFSLESITLLHSWVERGGIRKYGKYVLKPCWINCPWANQLVFFCSSHNVDTHLFFPVILITAVGCVLCCHLLISSAFCSPDPWTLGGFPFWFPIVSGNYPYYTILVTTWGMQLLRGNTHMKKIVIFD